MVSMATTPVEHFIYMNDADSAMIQGRFGASSRTATGTIKRGNIREKRGPSVERGQVLFQIRSVEMTHKEKYNDNTRIAM